MTTTKVSEDDAEMGNATVFLLTSYCEDESCWVENGTGMMNVSCSFDTDAEPWCLDTDTGIVDTTSCVDIGAGKCRVDIGTCGVETGTGMVSFVETFTDALAALR